MQYDVNSGVLQVVIEGEEINAVVGESARIDVGTAIDYIKSGQAEIEEAVQEGITEFNDNATSKTNDFNDNANDKTGDFNTNASNKTSSFNENYTEKLNDFNSNATDKTTDFNNNASDKTSSFNDNYTDKLNDFNSNATDKTNTFNQNATDKTTDFNNNATNKTTDFNNNYTEKKGLIDAQVVIAEGAATTATNQAGLAKQWAIGDPSEPVGNSSKYWAEYAESIAQTIGDPANKDLSNLSTTGNNRFVNLQQQIDAIVASSDVFDIVGTYAELQAYDITTVPVNDIIKVLVDSTHSNAATYYRCVESGGVKSWSYIGSEGAYYTKGEADNTFSTITGTGSALDYTGTTLSLQNSSGTTLSSVTIQSSPDIDGKSITKNSSQELQTIGVIDSNNTSNAIKTWTGTKAQYDAIVSKDANTEYLCTDTGEMYLGTVKIGDCSSRNIGEIIQSTIPLSDAGLHLLDGALINGAGSYSAFVTYIAGLVSNYPDLFITETDWQQSITDYGVCGKFVYDSTNNTVRLPKITGFTEGTTDVTALGDLVEAGLPNITGEINKSNTANNQMGFEYTTSENPSNFIGGAFSSSQFGTYKGIADGSGNAHTASKIVFDASLSNPIYGNSSTVQPQAIKVLYYIVLTNSVKTNIEVDIDEIATDLNGKVDVDLSNVNVSGTSLASGWSMPSSRYIDLTLGASGSTYTAPANGWYCCNKLSSGTNQYLNMHNAQNLTSIGWSTGSGNGLKTHLPVKKGDVIEIDYTAGGSTEVFRFFYAEGESNV